MYNIKWMAKQLIARMINKPVKGYKRTLKVKEILKLGGVL